MIIQTITFLLGFTLAAAQVATSIAVPLAIEAPDLRDGVHAVTVRWYDVAVGGTCAETELTSIEIQSSRATLVLGLTSPLPTLVLEGGHAWLSITFQGMPEPKQRYELLPGAFAQTSSYAYVAASLDPRATGIVTSINEIAGAIELIGTNGITVTRNGHQLIVSSQAISESGVFRGDGSSWEFIIRPAGVIPAPAAIRCAVESTHDAISTTWRFDPASGSYIVSTSAILQPDETLHWNINR